jgi:hypothetical protein
MGEIMIETDTDWFRNEAGDITHWCGGVPTNKEVIDRFTKTGHFGNIKHDDTNIELSKWFYPATLKQDQARAEAGLDPQHVCSACGKISPGLTKPITVGDPNESI